MDPTRWFQNAPYQGDRAQTPNMSFRPPGMQFGPAPPMGGMRPQQGPSDYERMIMQATQPKTGVMGALGGLGRAMGVAGQGPTGNILQQIAQMQQMNRQRQRLAQQYGQAPISWSQPKQQPQQGGPQPPQGFPPQRM